MDDVFRVVTGAILVTLLSVRLYGHALGRSSGRKQAPREPKPIILAQFLIGVSMQVLVFLYLADSPLVTWAQFALPEWARWLGAGLALSGIALLFWVHRALGRHFSGLLQLEAEHQLVTSGPYRWIRHPMYTSFYLGAVGLLLVSANALLGAAWLGVLTLMMIVRTGKEERMMLDQFGETYRAYRARTGRYLPKLV